MKDIDFFQKRQSMILKANHVVLLLQEALKGEHCEKFIADTADLIQHDEIGIAIENLIENLYEYKCPVPRVAYESIVSLCLDLNIGPELFSLLSSQVTEK